MSSATVQKKRANNRQRELLVERLHANKELARGNQADTHDKEFWVNLANDLNGLGCSRTVSEWQHIWSIWVSKIKTKARKIRNSINATGGGPGIGGDLSDVDLKVLETVGTASVFGHVDAELAIPSASVLNFMESDTNREPDVEMASEVVPPMIPLQMPASQAQSARSPRPNQTRAVHQRQSSRPRRSRHQANLVQALHNHSQLLHQSIIGGAEIIANAILTAGIPVFIPETTTDEQDTANNN